MRKASGLAGRKKFQDPVLACTILRGFLDEGPGRAVIVAHLGEMVRTLAQSANWRARVNEGAVLEHLDRLLVEEEVEATTPAALSVAFLTFATEIGSGLSKALRISLERRLGQVLDLRRAGSNQEPWLRALSMIFANPDHRGLAAATDHLSRSAADTYRVRLPDHAATLRALSRTDDPRGHLIRRRRTLPNFSTSTVHKAKGLEFRRVVVCPADQHQYPTSPYGARLFYVAISRAKHRLTIVTDTTSPVAYLDFA